MNREYITEVRDTMVRRDSRIYSDHFLVLYKSQIKGIDNKYKQRDSKTKIVKEM